MEVRPKEVDEALDYLLDYECFTPYQILPPRRG